MITLNCSCCATLGCRWRRITDKQCVFNWCLSADEELNSFCSHAKLTTGRAQREAKYAPKLTVSQAGPSLTQLSLLSCTILKRSLKNTKRQRSKCSNVEILKVFDQISSLIDASYIFKKTLKVVLNQISQNVHHLCFVI